MKNCYKLLSVGYCTKGIRGLEEGWEALVWVITMYARKENSGIIVLTYLAELFRPYPLSNNWWIWDKPLRGTRESTVVPPGRPPIDSAPKSWAELKRRKTNFPCRVNKRLSFLLPLTFAFYYYRITIRIEDKNIWK